MSKPSNSEIKLVRSLSSKKFRDREGLFVVEGEKMVAEALDSGFEPLKIWKREEIGEELMERMSSLSSPSPVLALLKLPVHERPSRLPAHGLFLALDGVRDPGNLGTILRIADWFGADGIFASEDTVDAFNPKTVQSSMGAVFRQPVTYCDIPKLCNDFRSAGISICATLLDGDDIYGSTLPSDALLLMGNESVGLSAQVRGLADVRLRIPSFAKGRGSESLNVAVATAICLSEFRRRQHL